jgi:hypothetical protein
MKISIIKFLSIIFASVLLATEAYASSMSGQIELVRQNQDSFSPARTSVILVGAGESSCGNNAYAFDNANTGIGKNMNDLLVAARQSSRPVFIQGNGICDSFNIEGISYIDME